MESPFVKASNHTTFETDVLKNDQLTLVDFWAEWCGPCKALAPVVANVAEKYQQKINVVSVDIEEEGNVQLQQQYRIRGLPSLLLFKQGEIVGTKYGAISQDQLEAFIFEHFDN
ncbi:MAG: thioredoxin [Legionellales bacterium]|nr:thioredoxin [Legionellales bacterium]|tara:strand:- start:378 stop:719 length:342 start_codon:yes stop_codon:yes gene_type:complete